MLVARQVLDLRLGQHLGEALGEHDRAVVLAAPLAGQDEIDDAIDERVEREPALAVLLGSRAGPATSSTASTRFASPAIATPYDSQPALRPIVSTMK